jgi:bifunctional UDP-N-acetylglucosamine pyrophosphorylase/glucosamine-1-phosphate N-acetyltransferase
MNSELPKVLHLIAQRPALAYIIETAKSANPKQIILVTSPSMDNVREFANTQCENLVHAIQEKPLGTGDAVKAAIPYIDQDEKTLILYADSPFITLENVRKIIQMNNDFTVIGFYASSPNKYGRLITYDNDLLEIIEFTDSSDEQKLIKHCNSGIICIKSSILKKFIPLIKNKNYKKEFYLTDIIKIAFQHDIQCTIFDVEENEVIGFNTREELNKAENIMQQRIKLRLMEQGVTFIQPETSYVAYDFEAGNDVTIYPNVFIDTIPKI